MLDTQNCLQNHMKIAKTIKCLLQSAFYREQSLSIGETGAEGNELGYETTAFAKTGV